MYEDQRQRQNAAREVARDHGDFDVPSIDEDTGKRTKEGQWDQIGDGDAGYLLRRAVELERNVADDGEESEEIPENTDELTDPEPAQRWDTEDFLERELFR